MGRSATLSWMRSDDRFPRIFFGLYGAGALAMAVAVAAGILTRRLEDTAVPR